MQTCFLLHRPLSSHCVLTWRKSKQALWGLLDSGTDPIPEDSCFMSWNSSLNHFPKASPPNTITLRVRFQHVDLGAGDTSSVCSNQTVLIGNGLFPLLLGPSTVLTLLLIFLFPAVGRGPRVHSVQSVLLSVLFLREPSRITEAWVALTCFSNFLELSPTVPTPWMSEHHLDLDRSRAELLNFFLLFSFTFSLLSLPKTTTNN